MDIKNEIDLSEVGVLLPTGGEWVEVPGSMFQVMTRGTDQVGTFRIRINPEHMHQWTPGE